MQVVRVRHAYLMGELILGETVVGICALASAAVAIGLLSPTQEDYSSSDVMEQLHWAFPLLAMEVRSPGEQPAQPFQVGAIIIHLNDSYGWTRELIAQWVESVEDALAVTIEETRAEMLELTCA